MLLDCLCGVEPRLVGDNLGFVGTLPNWEGALVLPVHMLMICLWGIGLALIDDNDHAVLTRVNDSFTVLVFCIKMLMICLGE